MKIVVYDILGNVVKEVYSGFQTPGKNQLIGMPRTSKVKLLAQGFIFMKLSQIVFAL